MLDLFGEVSGGAVRKSAVLSPCGLYRYVLGRVWDGGKPLAHWVMLNPSTADAFADDRTIRRCVAFARAWGCGGIDVRNLFAFRATDPAELRGVPDPVGPDNDGHLCDLAGLRPPPLVIAAWGAGGGLLGRDRKVLDYFRGRLELRCLKVTKHGHPQHPLYLKSDARPMPFGVEG